MISCTLYARVTPQPSCEPLSKLTLQGPKHPRLGDRPIRDNDSFRQAALRLAETRQALVWEMEWRRKINLKTPLNATS